MERIVGGGAVALVVGLLLISVGRLSSDAAGMAVGLIFGMLAGVPAALLTLYAMRQPAPPALPADRAERLVMLIDKQPQRRITDTSGVE